MAQETHPFLPEFDPEYRSEQPPERFRLDRVYARIFSRAGISPKEALDEDTGLTLTQIEVLSEELNYQDQVALAHQLQAHAMGISALSGLLSAQWGGDASSAMSGLQAMHELAQKLITEEQAPPKEEADRQLEHPMFQAFLNSDRANELRGLSYATRELS